MKLALLIALPVLVLVAGAAIQGCKPAAGPAPAAAPAKGPAGQWKTGPLSDPNFFPLTVWLQAPANAEKYKAIGINAYIGLWQGPTEDQLAALKKAGMLVVCDQTEVGLKHKDDPTILGWMHGDEPDNAQSDGKGSYGPPIATSKIIADYKKIKASDPARPVMLNLGQGVAWDGWYGRGVRTNHPEDYAEYAKGADVVSYDIYPVNGTHKDVKDKLWLVPFGVDRLTKWTEGKKPLWTALECTAYDGKGKPTPAQVKTEVWMSLIHGAKGIIYFVHVFKPTFIEAGLLADKEMAAAVGKLNKQITELAPVLNSPTVPAAATVKSVRGAVPTDPRATAEAPATETPIASMVKRHGGATYIFVVAMRDAAAKAEFTVPGLPAKATAEVLGEGRTIDVTDGKFSDDFAPYAVHLYKIK